MDNQKPNKEWKAIVAILGARRHYAIPIVLAENNHLEKFYTDWYSSPKGMFGIFRNIIYKSSFKILRRIAMRYDDRLPNEYVKDFPILGILYGIILRLTKSEKQRELICVYVGNQFGKAVAKLGFGNAKIVYGMNSASVEIFIKAKNEGLTCILDQCNVPYSIQDELMEQEFELWKDWQDDQNFTEHKIFIEREKIEWEIANLIICGSQFVADGLIKNKVSKSKFRIIPSAVDVYKIHLYKKAMMSGKDEKLKVLFLGNVGLRKGIQYLYQALELMKNAPIEVKAAGSISINPGAVRLIENRIKLLGLIPRFEVKEIINWADVLVLPSICEGSAMVTYEALASGLPIITTSNAGSPVLDGVNGFIVPIRDPGAIANRLEKFILDQELRKNMAYQARKYAEEHLSWEAYSKRFLAACESVIELENHS